MNEYGKYRAATLTQEKPASGKGSTECQANGCPLPGTYRISNEASLCCVHDGEDAHVWAEQTERILGRLRLWWLALNMSNADAGEPIKQKTIDEVLAEGGPGDEDVRTQRDYAQKIRAFLLKDCKGERKAPVQLTPVKALVAKLDEGRVMDVACSGLDVWSGYIAATCLGVFIGLVIAAVMETRNMDAQYRQVIRNWQPRVVRRKDPRL